MTLAAKLGSFAQAATAIAVAADVDISSRHVDRLTREVGNDLASQRDQRTASHRKRELACEVQDPPQLAVVEIDGGRLNTREANTKAGVHQKQSKEEKIACLLTEPSKTHPSDPQPEPPESFLHQRRVVRLVRQIKQDVGSQDSLDTSGDDLDSEKTKPKAHRDRVQEPIHRVRTCVATMENSRAFGPMVAAEAQARGFYQASRGAFVADGATYNWQIQNTYFRHFEPICDFLHVMCYVYTAAVAVSESEPKQWAQFVAWMRDCWQGRVKNVLEQLESWKEKLKPPEVSRSSETTLTQPAEARAPPGPSSDQRSRYESVRASWMYLSHNASRMDYPRYRTEGFPVTSSLVESLVGEFNARVKSPQKYWERGAGSEAILQVRAAVLSDDERWERYFAERPGCPFRRRPR